MIIVFSLLPSSASRTRLSPTRGNRISKENNINSISLFLYIAQHFHTLILILTQKIIRHSVAWSSAGNKASSVMELYRLCTTATLRLPLAFLTRACTLDQTLLWIINVFFFYIFVIFLNKRLKWKVILPWSMFPLPRTMKAKKRTSR